MDLSEGLLSGTLDNCLHGIIHGYNGYHHLRQSPLKTEPSNRVRMSRNVSVQEQTCGNRLPNPRSTK